MLNYLRSWPYRKQTGVGIGKSSGFTLIELLLSLAITSIIVMALISILNYSITACKLQEDDNEILLNAIFAIEYIKKEIRGADKIFSVDKFVGLGDEFVDNFGFVVLNYNFKSGNKYNYSVFYHKHNRIYRSAININTAIMPGGAAFKGNNTVAEHIISIEGTGINFETNLINLSITLKGKGHEETKLESILRINSPTSY